MKKRYGGSKEAQEFLKKHPEFNNFETVTVTSFPTYEPRFNPLKKEQADLILANLHRYPEYEVRELLKNYYDGMSIGALAKKLKLTKHQVSRKIFSSKTKVTQFIKSGMKVKVKGRKIHGQITLQFFGKMETIIKIAVGEELLWVTSDGRILEEDVQAYLEGDLEVPTPEFMDS